MNEAGHLNIENGPKTKQSGLYWIYTKYSNDDLLNAKPSGKRSSVNFSELVLRPSNLSNVCTDKIDEFQIVYDGIGGAGKKAHGGLRERILAEYRDGEGTGSLFIQDSSVNDLDNWRYSYVLWSEVEFLMPMSTSAFRRP